jgi:hypothetical protein
VPTQSQIEANRHTPQNTTGPASVTSTAVSSLNSPKTGAQVTIPPSPRNRTANPPVCDTKSSPMSATHSRKMAYPHTRNTHGFRVLRHNAPTPAATRPVDHSRNPLLGQRDKAVRHPEGTPFTGATGGAGPETASLEETQPLTPPIGFVPPFVSASPPHTRTEWPRRACTPATQPGTPLMKTVAVNVPLGHYLSLGGRNDSATEPKPGAKFQRWGSSRTGTIKQIQSHSFRNHSLPCRVGPTTLKVGSYGLPASEAGIG